jgi:hypothetical protein
MYSNTGPIKLKPGRIYGVDMLTSKGQNGGALCDTKTGVVYGIYTGIGKSTQGDTEKSYGFCHAITHDVVGWISGIE